MNVKEFVNNNYSFNEFTWNELERWWEIGLLDLELKFEFDDFEKIKEYHLNAGDIIGVASNFKKFNSIGGITYKELEKAQKDIIGLGNAGLSNIKKVLGSVFTLDELENKIDDIGYLGSKTVKNIRDYFE